MYSLAPTPPCLAHKRSSTTPRCEAHHQTILRQLGLVPINRVAAAKASWKKPRHDAKEQRVGETVFVETKEVAPAGMPSARVDLYARAGSIGAGTITVRLHANNHDTLRRFNRTENVRPIAPDDPGFTELFRRRNDAESINRAPEDTLWRRRAHSLGRRRQLVNMIGFAVMVNAPAAGRHRPPQAIAA